MSRLVLARHGQASFLADDYDQLSPLGYEQARHLARHWHARGQRFDHAFTGTLKRQRQTERAVAETLAELGASWPEPVALPELDEYPAESIMRALLPELRERDPQVRALEADASASSEGGDRYRTMHRLLEAVIAAWVEGRYETDGIKPWREFRDGVRGVLARVTALEGRGLDVAVFTSGGPIGVSVQTVLAAPDLKAADLNWRIHNCSLTQFTFSRARITLDSFNTVAHLGDAALLTYR